MIQVIQHNENISELRIENKPINIVDIDLLKDLRKKLKEDTSKGIIISGIPNIFCSGVDIPSLLNQNREKVYEYWEQVFLLASEMALYEKPIFAAITGQCIAAGVLIALFCDYRVMADGKYNISLSEVKVGVTLPSCFYLSLKRIVGSLNAERILIFGDNYTPQQAKTMGLVDEVVNQEDVINRSIEKLEQILKIPHHSLTSTRKIARQDLINEFQDISLLPIDDFVNSFMSNDTQKILNRLFTQ